jgi:hypothetical protein
MTCEASPIRTGCSAHRFVIELTEKSELGSSAPGFVMRGSRATQTTPRPLQGRLANSASGCARPPGWLWVDPDQVCPVDARTLPAPTATAAASATSILARTRAAPVALVAVAPAAGSLNRAVRAPGDKRHEPSGVSRHGDAGSRPSSPDPRDESASRYPPPLLGSFVLVPDRMPANLEPARPRPVSTAAAAGLRQPCAGRCNPGCLLRATLEGREGRSGARARRLGRGEAATCSPPRQSARLPPR